MNGGDLKRHRSLRWVVAYGFFGAPRAGASIAFAMAALSITDNAAGGATALAAMTAAQLAGAIPVARLGRGSNSIAYFKILIVIRTMALFCGAAACGMGAPYSIFIAAAVASGLVQGAAFGHLRDAANYLVAPTQMTRVLAWGFFAAELAFLVMPILAAALGTVSASLAIGAIAVLGALPAFILPSAPTADVKVEDAEKRKAISPDVLIWLACACASSAAISAIEVGAVSIAMGFGLQAGYGAVFTGTLCAASLIGAIVNSFLNRTFSRHQVAGMLAAILIGIALVLQNSFGLSIVGCALVGLFAPSLGIHYSLQINRLVRPEMRAETFSVLKISTSVGTILASSMLGWTSVSLTLTAAIWLLLFALGMISVQDLIVGRRLSTARTQRVPD
ncbi:MFS transporter [Rhizobium ruizarguesonis]|uniref:MFS transporter n=1 Tax=Rhizobium ruizarguesonis TaxID=2081791 RepID=UPI001447F029|nr:MFS transporter [Rhizobium ruizarguesonis]NKQ88741.1 hypothetical protein [Rhizobium ruizarguesonis]